MDALAEKLIPVDVVVHKHSNEKLIDITPKNIHKWNALKKLGIKEKQFVAFGNDTNDKTMFQHTRHSVRIGNHPELADDATESITLESDVEQKNTDKIAELSLRFSAPNQT